MLERELPPRRASPEGRQHPRDFVEADAVGAPVGIHRELSPAPGYHVGDDSLVKDQFLRCLERGDEGARDVYGRSAAWGIRQTLKRCGQW
jgi:hypothetical protein